MNDQVKNILYHRERVVANLERIISSSKKKQSLHGQMSMFGDENEQVEVELLDPESFNPYITAEKEAEVLGFSMTYSKFEEYEYVRCRYCDSSLYDFMQMAGTGRRTMLLQLEEVEYRTSSFGNPYAKITMGDDTGSEKIYLTGKLYKNLINSCFKGDIYLATLFMKEDRNIELVNMMPAKDALLKTKFSSAVIICNPNQIPTVRMYIKVFMMGYENRVAVYIKDGESSLHVFDGKIKVDKENLIEMRKSGIKVILR